MTEDSGVPAHDPADALTRKGCLIFLTGGFLVLLAPQAVLAVITGDAVQRWGAALGLGFFAWLTWRNVLLLRNPGVASDSSYWKLSCAGFLAFAVSYASYFVWMLVEKDQDFRDSWSMTFTMLLMLGLAAGSALAGGKAVERASAGRS